MGRRTAPEPEILCSLNSVTGAFLCGPAPGSDQLPQTQPVAMEPVSFPIAGAAHDNARFKIGYKDQHEVAPVRWLRRTLSTHMAGPRA